MFAQVNSVEIIFTANINGVLKNCRCGDPSLGGLARIITLVDQKRKINPDLIVIDGGDAFNPYSYPNLNRAAVELCALLKPDIIVPGDQEWIEGNTFLRASIKAIGSTFLLSNGHMDGFEPESRYSVRANSEQKLHILSYLHTNAFDLIQKPNQIILQENRFQNIYNVIRNSDFLVVIFHGPEKSLDAFIRTYPDVDLILLAHTQSDLVSLKKTPAIVSGGTDGEYLRNISIDFKDRSPVIQVRSIPVSLDIKPNHRALEIIKKWNIR